MNPFFLGQRKQVIKIPFLNWGACSWSPRALFGEWRPFLHSHPFFLWQSLFKPSVLDFVWHPCGETLCPQSVWVDQPVCGLTSGCRDRDDDDDDGGGDEELEPNILTTSKIPLCQWMITTMLAFTRAQLWFHFYFELFKDTKIRAV